MLPSKAGVRSSPPGTYSWGIYTQSAPRLTQPPVSWKGRQIRPTRHEDTRGRLPQPHSFSLGSSSCSLHLPASPPPGTAPLELLCWDVLRSPRQEHWLKSDSSECLSDVLTRNMSRIPGDLTDQGGCVFSLRLPVRNSPPRSLDSTEIVKYPAGGFTPGSLCSLLCL